MKLIDRANGNMPRTEKQKKAMIEEAATHYGKFLMSLGFDYTKDENSKDTPTRVAKAWINDLISGCVDEKPKITAFPNEDQYTGIVFEGNIPVISMCSHHNLPFIGVAHVAYIPGTKVIGLSKINRTVDWYSRRPQIQEGLTMQIHKMIDKICEDNKGVAVMIQAQHQCVKCRGIKQDSEMITAQLTQSFDTEGSARAEFYSFVHNLKK